MLCCPNPDGPFVEVDPYSVRLRPDSVGSPDRGPRESFPGGSHSSWFLPTGPFRVSSCRPPATWQAAHFLYCIYGI